MDTKMDEKGNFTIAEEPVELVEGLSPEYIEYKELCEQFDEHRLKALCVSRVPIRWLLKR